MTAELAAQLQRTVLSLESALKKIKQAEAVLNKTDAVTTGALTYSTHKAVSAVILKLTNALLFIYNVLCRAVPCQLLCVCPPPPVFSSSISNIFLRAFWKNRSYWKKKRVLWSCRKRSQNPRSDWQRYKNDVTK